MSMLDIFTTNIPPQNATYETDWVALVFLAILLLLFASILAGRMIPLWKRAYQLKSALDELQSKFKKKKEISEPEHWESIVWKRLCKVEWLADAVGEFEEQCWIDRDGNLRNAHQSSAYFTQGTVDIGNRVLFQSFPGIMTAVGILGTFIGITYGLMALDLNDKIDSAGLMGGIRGLIEALGISFKTSIWGLLFSMLSTITLSYSEGRFEIQRIRLISWLDSKLERGTEHDLLQELDKTQHKQLDLLQKLAGQTEETKGEIQSLAEQIGDAFENVIMGTAPGPGEPRSGGLADLITSTQSEGVGQMVNSFLDNMNTAVGSQFDSLETSIQSMIKANEVYQTSMGDMVQKLGATTGSQREAATLMSSAVGDASQAIHEARESVTTISDTASSLRSVSNEMSEVFKGQTRVSQEQQAATNQILKGLEVQSAGWQVHQEAISKAYNSIEGKFSSLHGALENLVQWHDKVKDELALQMTSWRAALEQQQGLTKQIGEERSGVTQMLEQLQQVTGALAGMRQGLEALAKQLESDLQAFQGSQQQSEHRITSATQELAGAGAAMGESWKEYAQVAEALTKGLPSITGMLEGIQTAIGVQERIILQGGNVAEQLQSTAATQIKLRDNFEAIAAAGESTRRALEPTADAISVSAQSLETAVDGMKSTQAATTALATNLQATTTSLKEANQGARQQWQEVLSSMERTTSSLDKGMTAYSEAVNHNVKTVLENFDEELRAAVSTLGAAVSGLLDVVESISDIPSQDS